MGGYIYMVTSQNHRALYIGVTNDLTRRIYEHRHGLQDGFTHWYHAHILVYYESFSNIKDAIARETQLKHWSRKKKEILIQRMNPEWKDLAEDWYT